nr:immunoglobulin light chain junction region [Macaca mulatta]MOX10147.1 immunoglobulin light chain junction region [Macaca mulatta]MOX10682.1 immunoglobulin light chain junction region [Macaca mulatta]
CMQALDFPLAF